MTLKDFKKLCAYCRSIGVTTYKSADVEFTLSHEDPKEAKRELKKHNKVEKTVEQKLAEMSEEDLLLYSSAGLGTEI